MKVKRTSSKASFLASRVPRQWARRLLLVPLVTALWSWGTFAAGATTPPGVPAAKDQAAKPVPKTNPAKVNPVLSQLEGLSRSAEEIYELAKVNKMERIPPKVEQLKKNAASFKMIKDENTMLLPRLDKTISDLEHARERTEVMHIANKITLIAATVAVPFKPRVPTEVALLQFNGRELEIWGESRKMDKLSGIVVRMHLAWQTLMPKLIEIGAIKPMRKFSEIMENLEVAKSSEEYLRLSRQVLSETKVMETLFLKASS